MLAANYTRRLTGRARPKSCAPGEISPGVRISRSTRNATYRLGANSYVAKPANFEKFSEAMQYLGWYWLSFNETP